MASPRIASAATTGLVAAYGFEEGSGTTLLDKSGNSNNGTLQNGPVWVTNGKFGKALKFDGGNDRVNIPESSSLDLTTGMTLEAWVYPTSSLSGWDTIVIKESASGLIYVLFANGDGNTPYSYITLGSTTNGTSGNARLPVNTWSHLASTYDGSTVRLFLNGTQVKTFSFSGSIQMSTIGLYLGGTSFLSNEGFPGFIDELRIYNRALAASEISADMQTPVDAASIPTTTVSPTKTSTPQKTATKTPTPPMTSTNTATPQSTATNTLTPQETPTKSPTPTAIFTATLTATNVSTPTVTVTSTPAITPTSSSSNALGPLKVSTVNPRYFADPNGKIVYLTGSHTWCDLMDCDDTNPISVTFNYTAFLDFLAARNHNFFRLWRAENARGGETGPNFWFAPLPYQRSTT